MSQLRSIPVEPLPLTSGGAPSQTQKDLEKTNTTLTMLLAQSSADSKFDPPPPGPITAPVLKESFASMSCSSHVSPSFPSPSFPSPSFPSPSFPSPYVLAGLAVVCILVGTLSK